MEQQAIRQACEQEPIHIPGLVQAHGVLLALSEPARPDSDWIIRQISANCAQSLGIETKDLLGASVSRLLGTGQALRLETALRELRPDESGWLRLILEGSEGAREFDAFVHRYDGVVIVELEWSTPIDTLAYLEFQQQIQPSITRIQGSADLTDLCRTVVAEVRRLTGYDRVMVYRFDDAWNGVVIAEAVQDGVQSYLGQHFPASDIPAQARRMFLMNWLRMIPDVGYVPISLIPDSNPVTGRPLDMSRSLLRSPSPIHIEYLKNMGVGASLTISLIHNERLWGLIACHHCTPKHIPHMMRNGCEVIGRLTSALLAAKEENEDLEYKRRLKAIHQQLLKYMSEPEDFVGGLVKHSPNLLELTSAEGAAAAIHFEGRWTLIGQVPRIEDINGLVKWLNTAYPGLEFFSTDSLPSLYPPAEGFKELASGLLAISIPKSNQNYVLWFRPEVIQTVTWAGNPEKPAQLNDRTVRLHPRKSFALWKERVRNKSLPWKPCELEAAAELRQSIVTIDLERQFRKERAARADTEAQRYRFAFLAEASRVLAESLNYEITLRGLAQLVTRQFCDWCVIYLMHEGRLQRTVIAHCTSEGQRVAEELHHYPLPTFAGTPLDGVLKGQPLLVTRVSRAWLHTVAEPARAAFLEERLGVESLVVAPLIARAQMLGIIEYARSRRARRFNEDDLQLGVELAGRAATAVDNALLYRASLQAIQARDHVLGIVLHDLKNPLAAIQINTEVLKRYLQKTSFGTVIPYEDFIHKIQRSCKRMRGLIEDMLSLSRIEAGRFTIEKTLVSAKTLLSEAFEMLEPLALAKSIAFKTSIRAEGCQVQCEPGRILQVFSNLVGNAIKFTPEYGQVTLDLEQCGPEVIFGVHDTGAGIPGAALPHIFDRFWQASRAESQGSGLGLTIAKGIIEAHGGQIWVESTVGHGSRFFFSLPGA